MSLPASFSNNTSPTGVQLDQNFAALGAMAVTHCTATGTNTITLSPLSSQPAVAAYTNQQLFDFQAAASSNGAVTLQVGSLSALPLYLIGGAQADSGDITISTPYLIQYLSTLNSGNGGFQLLSNVPSSAAVAQSNGLVHGLLMFNNSGTPNTKIDITAGYSLLTTTGGTPKFLASVSVTIDLTTTGANGMDTGARPTSGWVYCYIINNGSVTAGLATATSPTAGLPSPFPGGYSNFAYVGAMYCDASQNLLRTKQIGKDAEFQITASTNTATTPVISHGTTGTYSGTSPSLAVVTVAGNTAGIVPLTAGAIDILAYAFWKNGATGSVLVAPSSSWGGTNNGPVGSAGQIWPISTNGVDGTFGTRMVLEAASIGVAITGAGGAVGCYGWSDYYSAG